MFFVWLTNVGVGVTGVVCCTAECWSLGCPCLTRLLFINDCNADVWFVSNWLGAAVVFTSWTLVTAGIFCCCCCCWILRICITCWSICVLWSNSFNWFCSLSLLFCGSFFTTKLTLAWPANCCDCARRLWTNCCWICTCSWLSFCLAGTGKLTEWSWGLGAICLGCNWIKFVNGTLLWATWFPLWILDFLGWTTNELYTWFCICTFGPTVKFPASDWFGLARLRAFWFARLLLTPPPWDVMTSLGWIAINGCPFVVATTFPFTPWVSKLLCIPIWTLWCSPGIPVATFCDGNGRGMIFFGLSGGNTDPFTTVVRFGDPIPGTTFEINLDGDVFSCAGCVSSCWPAWGFGTVDADFSKDETTWVPPESKFLALFTSPSANEIGVLP